MSEEPLIVPPEWTTEAGLPNAQEVQRMATRLEELRAERKAAEEAFPVPGGDFVWWSPIPPARAWTVDGVLCALSPAPIPMICGYVQLPRGHPWSGRDLTSWSDGAPDIDVHGGITWHHARTDWIGFDTGHAWDHWSPAELQRCRDAELVSDARWAEWEAYQRMTSGAGIASVWARDPHSRRWSWEQVVAETVMLAGLVRAAA